MKKTLLIALVLLLSSGMAIAQQQGGPGGSQKGGFDNPGNFQDRNSVSRVERMTEHLGLDEAQAAEIAAIFEEAQLVRNEERERSREIAMENRVITHALIMNVLSPVQQALFEEQLQQREQMRQAFEEMRQDRGFGGRRGSGDCDN